MHVFNYYGLTTRKSLVFAHNCSCNMCHAQKTFKENPGHIRDNGTMPDALEPFSPATQQWFRNAFGTPTAAQEGAWESISKGENALIIAPTGSGKTLAAFLWALDALYRDKSTEPGQHELTISTQARKNGNAR